MSSLNNSSEDTNFNTNTSGWVSPDPSGWVSPDPSAGIGLNPNEVDRIISNSYTASNVASLHRCRLGCQEHDQYGNHIGPSMTPMSPLMTLMSPPTTPPRRYVRSIPGAPVKEKR